MKKETQGPAPEEVREQAAQYAIRLDPGERVARLEGEINHMATSTEVSELKRHVDIGFKDVGADFKDVGAGFKDVDARFKEVDAHFKAVDARFTRLDEKVDARFTRLDEKLDAQIAASERSEKMMRWALGLIVSLLAVVLASMIGG